MKKSIKFIFALLMIAAISVASLNSFAAANVIKINGETAQIPQGFGEILETDNRTFVPLRFISEFLKNEVWFDDASKTAGVASPSTILLVQNGNNILYVVSALTGETVPVIMDTAAFIKDGRTYIPIRFLAEALGYTVGWDEATQTVTLDKK